MWFGFMWWWIIPIVFFLAMRDATGGAGAGNGAGSLRASLSPSSGG